MPKEIFTADKVVACLRNRFSEQGKYVILEQVPDGTGAAHFSHIDAIVFSLWPSLGCRRTAFEVKVSRGDWLSELKNPEKNEWAREVCHEFCYAAPSGVIKEEELPTGCGLYICSGDSLRVVRAPVRKEPQPIDDVSMAAFVRAMQKEINRQADAVKKNVAAHDKDVQNAFFWEAALKVFFHKHGSYLPYLNPGSEAIDALKALEGLTANKAVEHDRTQLVEQTEHFRRAICDAFESFVNFAYIGILETDKQGKFISKYFHSPALDESLSRYAKDRVEKMEKIAQSIIRGPAGTQKVVDAIKAVKPDC